MAVEVYPQKPVARPNTSITVDTSSIGGSSSNSEKVLMLVGSATGGKPDTVYSVRNYAQAKSVFRSGELLDAIELAWNPATGMQGAGNILAMRVEDATASTLEKGGLTFDSLLYGQEANEIQIALEENTLTDTKRLRVNFVKDNSTQIFDNLGSIFSVKYSGEEALSTATVEVDSVTKLATKLTLRAGTAEDAGTLPIIKTYELGSGTYTDTNVLVSDINNLPDFSATFFPIGNKNVPTSTFDAVADLDIKNKEKVYVTALGGDIEKQLQYNSYVTVKVDRSTPITEFPLTKLAGGTDGTIPESWSSKFKHFANEGGYYLVPLTDKEAVHYEALAFVTDRTANADPMRILVGGGTAETLEATLARAQGLRSARANLIGFSASRRMDDGRNMKFPAYMMASQIAGLASGLPIGSSVTFKNILIDALDVVYESEQLDQFNQSGVMMAEFVRRSSTSTNFRIVDDVTTYNDKSDPVKNELAVGEANDFLCAELKIALDDTFIGEKVINISPSLIKNFIQSFLDRKKLNNEIQDYAPEEVQVIIDGDTVAISLVIFPIRSMKKIAVSIIYRQQILSA